MDPLQGRRETLQGPVPPSWYLLCARPGLSRRIQGTRNRAWALGGIVHCYRFCENITQGEHLHNPPHPRYATFTSQTSARGLNEIGLVILPSFISKQKQRDLVVWSLARHACQPNDTNLDIHYHLPTDGLWNSWLGIRDGPGKDFLILPKASSLEPPQDLPSGPRKLVNNEPVSPETFQTISSVPKPPQIPSPTLQPILVSSLIHKLRWANIGWFYHWGTKQYDFTRGKVKIDDELRSVCKEAVQTVDWKRVHGSHDDDWGGSGPDWDTWDSTYGKPRIFVFRTLSNTVQNPMLGSWISIKKRPGNEANSVFIGTLTSFTGYSHGACRSLWGLCHISPCFHIVSLLFPHHSIIALANQIKGSEMRQSSWLVEQPEKAIPYLFFYDQETSLLCLALLVDGPTMECPGFWKELFLPTLDPSTSMTKPSGKNGNPMKNIWRQQGLTLTFGKYFPKASILVHKFVYI